MNVDSSFDFKTDILIIGAGSAGCSVAAGLIDGGAVDPAGITIVESGSIDRPHQRHPDIRQPAGYPRRFGSSDDWAFSAQGGAGVSHRKIAWPRGRGVGGSTRINAMIWLPPPPHDVAQLLTHLREPRGRHRDDDLQSLHAMWDRSFQCVSQRIQAESPRYLSEPVQFFLQAATDAARSPLAYQRMNRRGQRTGAETMIASSMDEIRFVGGTVSEVLFDGDRAIGVRCDNERIGRGHAQRSDPGDAMVAAGDRVRCNVCHLRGDVTQEHDGISCEVGHAHRRHRCPDSRSDSRRHAGRPQATGRQSNPVLRSH
ncbi:MAG: GMC family oxidoreductase N-terminal domain-containing protein [Planctomycetota bacterium]